MDNIQRYIDHFDRQVSRSAQNTAVLEFVDDGYNSTAQQIRTSYFSRKDYDDGSFDIQQSVIGPIDKTIRFGPLQAKLSELFALGFILQIEGWKNHRSQKLRLVRGNEQYKLAKIRTDAMDRLQDLTTLIRDCNSPSFEIDTDKPRTKLIIKEVRIQTDPFEELMLRYPVVRKPVELIGNQTIDEYVKQQLREQRKLENV